MKKLLIILLFILTSCGGKKTTVDIQRESRIDTVIKTTTRIDTVFKEKIVTKTLPVYSTIEIEKPCDEFGNLKPINQTIGSGKNISTVRTENGRLLITQYIDSTANVLEKEYRSKFVNDSIQLRKELIKESTLTKKVVRYIWPWWVWGVIIGGLIFAGLYVYRVISRI
jgi:hypothetical protein